MRIVVTPCLTMAANPINESDLIMEVIKISNMTGKLKGFRAISTNTLTNEFCVDMFNRDDKDLICTECYSAKNLQGMRKNCVSSRQHNSEILSGGIIPPHMLPTLLDAFIRISADGELINLTHLENIHNIALHNPHCVLGIWTKRKDLINKFYRTHTKPANMILIFSNARIDKPMSAVPKHFDRTFNTVRKNNFKELQNCTGQKCIDCMACYLPTSGVTQIVEAVK